MSHWNYRILARKISNKDIEYGLYEVHYDDYDNPIACTENPVYPISFSSESEDPLNSIKWQLDAMKVATEKPVLDYDSFPKEYMKYSRKMKLKAIEETL
jgi:hypothetical protein